MRWLKSEELTTAGCGTRAKAKVKEGNTADDQGRAIRSMIGLCARWRL
jgi:hypothetical protein